MLDCLLNADAQKWGTVWRGLRMALMRTHGVMLFTTRPRYQRDLEAFRDQCRAWQPVVSKYERFDVLGSNPEDVKTLLRIALKGDVVDVGTTASGAFDVLYALLALGVPRDLVGSESFLAGIVHLQPLRRITAQEETLALADCSDLDLVERVNIALNGATDAVRLRSLQDPGVLFPYVEIYLPHPRINSAVQEGRMQEAYDQWIAICREYGPRQVIGQALHDVALGRMDPRDLEGEMGSIQWQAATRDRVVQGHEM